MVRPTRIGVLSEPEGVEEIYKDPQILQRAAKRAGKELFTFLELYRGQLSYDLCMTLFSQMQVVLVNQNVLGPNIVEQLAAIMPVKALNDPHIFILTFGSPQAQKKDREVVAAMIEDSKIVVPENSALASPGDLKGQLKEILDALKAVLGFIVR